MRKLFFTFAVAVAALFLAAGCASTHSTITEYDAAGNIVKKTESSESVIHTVTKSTQNKTVVIWEDGWAAYISASTTRSGRRSTSTKSSNSAAVRV